MIGLFESVCAPWNVGGIPADIFAAPLSLATAVVVAIALLVMATVIAIRRLRVYEISGEAA